MAWTHLAQEALGAFYVDRLVLIEEYLHRIHPDSYVHAGQRTNADAIIIERKPVKGVEQEIKAQVNTKFL